MRNTHLTFIRNALNHIGAPLPTAFADAERDEAKIIDAGRKLSRESSGYLAIAGAWGAAVLEDRDPSTDPGIITALIATALGDGNAEYAATNIVEARLIAELPSIHDHIMKPLRVAVAKAADQLIAAHKILGDTALNEISTIHNLGPAALQASLDAQAAAHTIRQVDTAWRAMAELTHFASPDTSVLVRLSKPDATQFDMLRNEKDVWVLVQNGVTLNLAITADEVRERNEHVSITRAQRDAAYAEQVRRDSNKSIRFK